MRDDLTEKGYEELIEECFLKSGYIKGDNKNFDIDYALDINILFEFLENTQPEELERLKKNYKDRYKEKLTSRIYDELNSRGTIDVLRNKVKDMGAYFDLVYFKPATKLNPEAFQLYESNIFTIYRQVHYSKKTPNKSFDMMICLNGIPIAIFELKNQTTGQSVLDGMKEYREERDPNDLIFQFMKRAIVYFVVDTDEVYMTTHLRANKTFFFPFNKGVDLGRGNPVNPNGYKTAYLWEEILQKDSLLDILSKYVQVLSEDLENEQGETQIIKKLIFPRYHQLDTIRKILADVKNRGSGKRYLIQHSAGSGKTLTISLLAHRLSNLHDNNDNLIFNSIIVISDRIVIDNQLQDSIEQIDHKMGVVERIDKRSEDLAKALNAGSKIIITTMQKFIYILEKVENIGNKNFAIIIDEVHSSFTGTEYMKAIKKAFYNRELERADIEEDEYDPEDYMNEVIENLHPQKNLSMFAFTATPKARTIELFGEKDNYEDPLGRVFHLYPMRQAIEEKFIMDVLQNYTTYNTYFQLNKNIEDDPQYDKRKARRSLSRFITLHEVNIAQKTEIIVEHFQHKVRHKIGGKAKALVVTGSRALALRYKRSIDNYIKERKYNLKTLIAFSGSLEENGDVFKESDINKFGEKELPRKFASDEYQMLIVAQKYQTGFDQPLLHTMYVDKKLKGLNAVQTLSRLNRIHKGKDDTFILDFVNKPEDIQNSFRPYYEATIIEEFTNPNILYDLESKLNAYYIYSDEEIDKFINLYLKPKKLRSNRDRALINSYIDAGIRRYEIKPENEKQDFKSLLKSFIRLYSYIVQLTFFSDLKLHKLYLYLSFLIKKIPKDTPDGQINLVDEVALEYYRNEKVFEGTLSLQPEGEIPINIGGVKGSKKPLDEKDYLSSIIERLNEQFGTEFTEADRLSLEQIKEDFAANKELIEKAQVNTMEDFKFPYNKAFMDIVFNRMEQNEQFYKKILNDEQFRNVLMGYLLPETYKKLQTASG